MQISRNYKEVLPRYNQIVTTADVYEKDVTFANGMVDLDRTKGRYKTQQKVVAVGDTVRNLNPGDMIEISWDERRIRYSDEFKRRNLSLAGLDPLSRFSHMDSTGMNVEYPVVEIDGTPHFVIWDTEVLYRFIPQEAIDYHYVPLHLERRKTFWNLPARLYRKLFSKAIVKQ